MTKEAFEAFIREWLRPDLGDEVNDMTEEEFLWNLSEFAAPDYEKWQAIEFRVHQGGELTPREREQAIAYYCISDVDELKPQDRLA